VASNIAGVLILALLLAGGVAMSRAALVGNAINSGAQKQATELVGERARTDIDITGATGDTTNSTLTITVVNRGATAVADFSKTDLVVQYTPGTPAPLDLTYKASGPLVGGEWTMTLDPATDLFEPGIFNPGETMTITAKLVGIFAAGDTGTVTVSTPKGVADTRLFTFRPFEWTFHSEISTISATNYYQLKNQTPADGAAATISSSFSATQTGRVNPSSNNGKFVFPLTGISQLEAITWETTYRAKRDKADMGFVWSVNADDISLTSTGSWQDIDLSAYVSVGATGAIVEVVNTGTSAGLSGLVRGKEDTRDYMADPGCTPDCEGIEDETHRWQIVKIDSNRLIQGYIESTDIDFKLLGYTVGPDPSYFTTPPQLTTGVTGSWTTIDLFSLVDADADGAILLIDSVSSLGLNYAVREVSSTFSTTDRDLEPFGNTMYLVGLNTAKHFEVYIEQTDVKIYLVGQTKGSVSYYFLDIPVADTGSSAWENVDADDYGVLAAASGLVFRVVNDHSVNDNKMFFRHAASTDDWNGDIGAETHFQAAIGLRDSDNQWTEFNKNNTDVDVFIAAYTRLVRMDAHADIDIRLLKADGTERIAAPFPITGVANTSNITSTDWQTFTATYAFPSYTVADQTDYLEITLFAEATSNISQESVSVDFRIDDPDFAVADQMKIREVP